MQRQDMSDDSDEKVESIIPIRNHTAMKFNGSVQLGAGVIHGGVQQYYNNPNLPREPLPAFFQPDIPFFAEDRFVRRDALLEQIVFAFVPDQHATQKWRPITALTAHGLGGVGKTQLALYYYYYSPKSYSFRCWFPAERLDIAYRAFCKKFKIEIDEKMSIEEISQEVKQWLEEHPGWLLVYDNVTDCNSIAPHLPTTGGDVLITSRHTQEWDQIGGREVFVDIVSEEEGIELVKRAISPDGKPAFLSEKEEVSLKELARELGYLPLALAQAAAYIKSCPGMTITSYLDKYTNTPDVYLDKALNQRTYPTSVAKTWLITMEEIEKRLPAALPVFKACAYLAPDAIPTQLLSQLTLELNPHFPGLEKKEGENEEDKLKNNPLLDEILICLSGFSMIGHNKETNHVSVHRLVQAVIRYKDDKELFSVEERFETRLKLVSNILLKIDISWSKDPKYYAIARLLYPHFEAVITYLELLKLEKSQLILLVGLCDTLGSILSGVIGDTKKAVKYYEHALKILEVDYEKDINIAIILNNLGAVYGQLGDYTAMRDYLERALKIQEAHYEKDHVEVAKTVANLGNAYGFLGDYAKKRDYLERALKIQEAHYGKDHVEVARTVANLGGAYGSLGDHAAMCNYLERALKIDEIHYGKDHVEVAKMLNNLGIAYGSLGDRVAERNYLERALKIKEAHYGKDHVEIAAILSNLANTYGSLDNHVLRHDYLERVLKIEEAHYGKDHVKVGKTLNNLGNTYRSLGDHVKECDYLERALKILEDYYGKDHIEVAKTLHNLGIAYRSLGDQVKERDYLERALKIKEAYYKKDNVDVAVTLTSLGNAYGSLGDHIKERNYLERALKIMEAHYGKDHAEMAGTLNNLGGACGALGDHILMRDYLERALKIDEAHYGKDHVVVAGTLTNLGNTYGLLNDSVKARDYLERALKIKEASYEKDHAEVAKALANLGIACGSLGDHIKARDYLERALKILMTAPGYGKQHPHTQTVMRQLAIQPASTAPAEATVQLKEKEEKQKRVGGFFHKEQLLLQRLIKKYKLLDNSQPSLEKGLRNAAANGSLEDLALFSRYVKNLNAQDENPRSRKTAAHWAAVKSHEDCYNFLVVEKKVLTDIPDASNKKASEYRVTNQKIAVTQS